MLPVLFTHFMLNFFVVPLVTVSSIIGQVVFVQLIIGTLSRQDEFVDDDERRRVRSGSRTSSKAGKTSV